MTGAIIPPELPWGMKFDITSAIILLLNLKGIFSGLLTNDANIYVVKILGIYTSDNISGVSNEAIRLRLFSFSLIGKATLWLAGLQRGSITT